jgi:hypothetical protein
MLSWDDAVFGKRTVHWVATWLNALRRTSILQELRDSQQPTIWLFIAAGMVMAVFVVRLVLIIPVNAGDFRDGGAYGFNGPFGGGGGFGGLGRG